MIHIKPFNLTLFGFQLKIRKVHFMQSFGLEAEFNNTSFDLNQQDNTLQIFYIATPQPSLTNFFCNRSISFEILVSTILA